MSVEKLRRKSGAVVWRVRWREAGRNRSRVLSTHRDAADFDAELRRCKRAGTLAQLDAGSETLDGYVTGTWWPGHTGHLAASTRVRYAELYDCQISPHLGSTPLRDLTADVIGRWQAERLAVARRDGRGHEQTLKALTLLGAILQRALEGGRIVANPQRMVRRARRLKTAEVRPLAPSQVEAMRAAASPRDRTLIGVLAYAGLRPGEALTLRWRHVQERTIVVDAAKTGERRTVRLLAPLATDLAEWRMACGRPSDAALVFGSRDGEVWSKAAYQSWRRRSFGRACEAARLGQVTPYTLRHSFCSLLLAEGRSVIYVARQLGHGARLTLGTYGHVIDELDGSERVDAEAAIRAARRAHVPVSYLPAGGEASAAS